VVATAILGELVTTDTHDGASAPTVLTTRSSPARLHGRVAWNTRLVNIETQEYEPDEDPDTGPARTPEEVDSDADRDQAEGTDEPEEGTG
jgi:hypothetical protein